MIGDPSPDHQGFLAIGGAESGVAATPVVISVPHAGRDYPAVLLDALRGPAATLAALEDRYIDAVALAAQGEEAMLIQRRGRGWIDLNRDVAERDPAIDAGAAAIRPGAGSAKVLSGLGLVPRRTGRTGELWRRRFTADEVEARIASDHRPYHRALAAALAAARARFGTAVLLDLHSMPPLARGSARVVIGDRFGRSAAPRFVARARAAVAASGRASALNAPYAGGHIVERHGHPGEDIHAVQVEIDRSLYLDARLDRPGPGLAAAAAMVRAILDALADEALNGDTSGGAATLVAAE